VSDTPQIRNVFIRRPIFSGVISIVIVLLGLFSLGTLPVNSYPALTPPEIQVQAVYPGATARTSPRPSPRRSNSSCRGSRGCSTSSRRTRATAS